MAKSLIHSVHGRNLLYHSQYWRLSIGLDTRSPLQSSGRPSLLVCKTGTSLVSLRQVSTPSSRVNPALTTLSGSGKTAAFVIPMLAFISGLPLFTDENRHLGPYALIMAPTRELAQQIESEAKKFAGPLGFTCVSIVGGVRGGLSYSELTRTNTQHNFSSVRLRSNSSICVPARRSSSPPLVG